MTSATAAAPAARTVQALITVVFLTGESRVYYVDRDDLDQILKIFNDDGTNGDVITFLADDSTEVHLNLAAVTAIQTWPARVLWELRTSAPTNDVHRAITSTGNDELKASQDEAVPSVWVVTQRGLAERAPYALRNVAAWLIGNGYTAELAKADTAG
jgi:hypothetical protein